MVFFQSVMRGAEILAQGEITVACVDRNGLKPRRLPPDVVGKLQGTHQQQ
jgi:acyl-CoA thioesterase FadM